MGKCTTTMQKQPEYVVHKALYDMKRNHFLYSVFINTKYKNFLFILWGRHDD